MYGRRCIHVHSTAANATPHTAALETTTAAAAADGATAATAAAAACVTSAAGAAGCGGLALSSYNRAGALVGVVVAVQS